MRISIKLVLIGVMAASTNLSACVCAADIIQGFTSTRNYIVGQNVNPMTSNVRNQLIPKVNQNKADIDAQNELLRVLIKAEQAKGFQYKKMIFLLQQQRSLFGTEPSKEAVPVQ